MGYRTYCPFLEITTQNTNSFLSVDPKLCNYNSGKHELIISCPSPHFKVSDSDSLRSRQPAARSEHRSHSLKGLDYYWLTSPFPNRSHERLRSPRKLILLVQQQLASMAYVDVDSPRALKPTVDAESPEHARH